MQTLLWILALGAALYFIVLIGRGIQRSGGHEQAPGHGSAHAGGCCGGHSRGDADETAKDETLPGHKDPVCGMQVTTDGDNTATYNGTTFYFCSEHCLARFKASPAQFADTGRPTNAAA